MYIVLDRVLPRYNFFCFFLFTDEEDEFNVSVVGSENGHGGGTTSTSRRRHHHKIAMAYNA